MKRSVLFTLMLLVAMSFSAIIQAQTRTITGVVKDEMGEPLIGVSVMVKGTNIGTLADMDGEFSLNVPDNPATVIILNYIGFLSREVTIGSETRFEIVLQEDEVQLDEMVVVGYGTQRRSDVTGSISTVSGSSLNQARDRDKKASTWKRSGMADNSIRLEVGDGDFIPLEAAQIAVQIDGFRVRVLMDCFFYNDKRGGLEGTFKLKLPTDATPYYFAFGQTEYLNEDKKDIPYINYDSENFNLTYKGIEYMNDRVWDDVKEARIVSKQKAAKAYEQTVSAGIDPALMEWGGADMFACRVFPLAMNTLHRVVIGYDLNMTEALDFREYILAFPKVKKDLVVNISAYDSPALPFEIMPETKPYEIKDSRNYYSFKNPKEKEFTIHYNSIRPVVLHEDNDDAYFGANYRIELPEQLQEDLPEDAVFMLDVSLSSNPDKFNVWLKLIEEILTKNKDIIKRFAVIGFNIDNFWYQGFYTKNNYYNMSRFIEYANNLSLEGATDIASALAEASNPRWLKNNRPKHIFLMSDADYNWGETNKHTFIKTLNKGDRVHTYKTGLSGTNVGLLNFLSNSTNGFSFTVTGEEEAELTAKSFRYRPWVIEEITVDDVKDFLISGAPSQLYNGQKLIFTGRGMPSGNIHIKVNNGLETKQLVFQQPEKINSVLPSRVYGQIALSYLDNYGFKAEEAAINYSTHYQVPGQYTSFLMLESESDYDEYGIDDSDAKYFVKDNLVEAIIKELEKQDTGLALGNSKINFMAWLDKLSDDEKITEFSPGDDFRSYVKGLPEDIFKVQLKAVRYSMLYAEQQSDDESQALSNEDLRFDNVYKLARTRLSRYKSKGDALKLLSSVVERNASDIQAIRDIAMAATDWGMGDQAYYMMRRIIDWRQGEAVAYHTAANALAKSGNVDMALIYYYICLNSEWDSKYGDFKSIVGLELLKYLNEITDKSKYTLTAHTARFVELFRTQVEELLEGDGMLISEADIVVIVSWNVDDTDIDLHVLEPTGEECYYSHPRTEIGGLLTKDVTDGYGPEMYVLEKTVPGIYGISLKYYSSSSVKTASKAKAYIDVYRDWGRKNEKVTRKTILLETVQDKESVMKFNVK